MYLSMSERRSIKSNAVNIKLLLFNSAKQFIHLVIYPHSKCNAGREKAALIFYLLKQCRLPPIQGTLKQFTQSNSNTKMLKTYKNQIKIKIHNLAK